MTENDCIYIMTQGELDELEAYLEVYKSKVALGDTVKQVIDALSKAFAQVKLSVEEILKGFSDWWLEITGDAPEIYKPRPKPKRPQRKILEHGLLIDRRSQARRVCPRRGAM